MESRTTVALVLGLVFHLFYIMSVFDCYFTSPVVHGMQQFRVGSAEAERLVLIVADGLRADLLFKVDPFPAIPGAPSIVAPYLRSVVKSRGAFGVSHTRVPTESRPGHVAIIAGMYEDVSAVTKGWKTNPVDFDSVFNQSSHTFSFGSPDILPMFAQGAVPGRVKTWSYNEDDEDFTKDATALDVWVYDRLESLFYNASADAALNTQLHSKGTVFFLHLLGLDTTGHSYRPHSAEYMNNIKVVDHIVNKTERLVKEIFHDDETAFIFTADHGMSNIGNHGDGTLGPPSSRGPWQLSDLIRQDVEQADIAPLMAFLLGINYPVNSVGVLPDVNPASPGYLSPRNGEKAQAQGALVNAKVILEQYRVKHRAKAARTVLFKPYPGLTIYEDPISIPGTQQIAEIERLLITGKWKEARLRSRELIDLSLRGLRYLQTYDRGMIRIIVIAGYLGWAGFSATSLILTRDDSKALVSSKIKIAVTSTALIVLVALWGLFAVQRCPWTYYGYAAFPCYFWHEILQQSLGRLLKPSDKGDENRLPLIRTDTLKTTLFGLLSLQSMVVAYTHRSIWSMGFVVIGVFWPLIYWPQHLLLNDRRLLLSWSCSCLVTALFPLRNVEQSESATTILAGGCAMVCAGAYRAYLIPNSDNSDRNMPSIRDTVRDQVLFVGVSMLVTFDSVTRLQAKTGLPLRNQVIGWGILIISVIYPKLAQVKHTNPYSKLLTLFLAFAPCFIVLSIAAEGLFYLAYCTTLFNWIAVEKEVRPLALRNANRARHYIPCKEDVRIALFFLFFVQVAFFGTGNVASVSSFYLEPVYRLVPVFNPFIMASLLVFKIVAPYVILSAAFATLNSQLGLPPFSLFLVALSLTDGMTITFFLNVTDSGSWLEIGQSISFFVITSLLLVWSAGVCALGEWLMSTPTNASTPKVKNL